MKKHKMDRMAKRIDAEMERSRPKVHSDGRKANNVPKSPYNIQAVNFRVKR